MVIVTMVAVVFRLILIRWVWAFLDADNKSTFSSSSSTHAQFALSDVYCGSGVGEESP